MVVGGVTVDRGLEFPRGRAGVEVPFAHWHVRTGATEMRAVRAVGVEVRALAYGGGGGGGGRRRRRRGGHVLGAGSGCYGGLGRRRVFSPRGERWRRWMAAAMRAARVEGDSGTKWSMAVCV